jgi:hypothetical protein
MSNSLSRHNIKKDNQIALLKKWNHKKAFVLRNGRQNLADFDVFIIDSIVFLQNLGYADIAVEEVLGIRCS